MALIKTVTLGEKKYEIKAKTMRDNKAWRDQFGKPFELIVSALTGMGDINLSDGKGLGGLVSSLKVLLLGSMDLIVEMLYAYVPAIAADAEYLQDNAYDDQIVDAFVAVLQLAYPLGGLTKVIRRG